jgi:glutathione S-transferase
MSELILHHYPESPFSEKIRVALGLKNAAWRSVLQPMTLPKPEQVALTGGYRRAPVLQIGANIYCDTKLIAEIIEERIPEPTLFPRDCAGAARMNADWADQIFFRIASVLVFQPRGARAPAVGMPRRELMQLLKDRVQLMKDARVIDAPPAFAPEYFAAWMEPLNAQLERGQAFLLGDRPCIADCALYNGVWFIRSNPTARPLLDAYPALAAWADRIAALGHGRHADLSREDALKVARSAAPVPPESRSDHPDFPLGAPVEILPTDYGRDPVAGELAHYSRRFVAIRRRDEQAGEVFVHFPIAGYRLRRPGEESE